MTIPETPPPDKSPDRIAPAKALESDQTLRSPQGHSFTSYMEKGVSSKGGEVAGAGPTPMELAKTAGPTGMPTMNSLLAQTKTAQDSLGTVGQQLKTPNLQLKRSQAHLLKNKLTDAQTYSRAVAAKLGVETAPMKTPQEGGVLARFLAYIGDGQDQFAAVQSKLQQMSASGDQINPGEMMLLQSKLSLAQQEIEYSSTLLSKIVSSITTIMGIQL